MRSQLERLRRRVPEEQDILLLEDLLESAKEIILSVRYPFGTWPETMPRQFEQTQLDIAVDIYNRMGAEGQTGHSENSVSRTWGSEWVSKELLQRITPLAGGLG